MCPRAAQAARCTGKRVFFAGAAVPPSYAAGGAGASGPLVQLQAGDYVAVEVTEGTAGALRASALARTSITEFMAVEGSTAPLLAPAGHAWRANRPDAYGAAEACA